MKKILFQGDSITDAGRWGTDDAYIGLGYATLVKAELTFNHPGEYLMQNRGISGNRIVDLYARMKTDILNLKPDVMSILIGVNDVWHEFEEKNGVDADKYFKVYSLLIEEIKEALPDIKIMILEPFTLQGSGNEKYWDEFRDEVAKRAEKAREIAEKYNLTFVPLQDKFNEVAQATTNDCWLVDGVHPQAAGHELIKREWIKAFNNL